MAVPRSDYASTSAAPYLFRPPKISRRWVHAVQHLLPLLARLDPDVAPVEVEEADLESLRALAGQRVVLTANHPEGFEPYALFQISRLLHTEFNYLAAKEVFEEPPPAFRWVKWLGLYAPILQRLGVYSIARGTADRDSFRTTRELLVRGDRWIVIFPEGEVSWHSDTLLPLQQGVAQFGFGALDELSRAGTPPPLYFVPVVVKLRFQKDVDHAVDQSLRRLEHKLRLGPPDASATHYMRLLSVGEAILVINEKRYGLRPTANTAFGDRIREVKESILARIALAVGVPQNREQPLWDRIRELYNALDRIVHEEYGDDVYEQRVRQLGPEEVRSLYGELSRMQHVAALDDSYVRETMSAERFYDVLGQLEWEVFRRRSRWGPRTATVRIGEPINLAEHLDAYRADRRAAREEVTRRLEAALRTLLSLLAAGDSAVPN